MTHRTACQFCGQVFDVEIEEEALAFFRLEKLLAMAACNKCANKKRAESVHRARQAKSQPRATSAPMADP